MYCGAQVSLYPMCGRFVEIILDAADRIKGREGLRIETDDISTLIVGPSPKVFGAVKDLYLHACRSGEHAALNALFSRGCPGEPDDPICSPGDAAAGKPRLVEMGSLPESGIILTGQFSVYPLGIASYMSTIVRQIEAAKNEGVFDGAKHFASRLRGDGEKVFAALYNAFERAAEDGAHIVIHATLSSNSPSAKGVRNE